ncbi:hypothetical protein FPQ18DRAFT_159586 [Pyronema domesticum]|nr:hypothetical protein FPQ18DRAFT_159586 [Pyronema domesticum]
MTMKMGFKCQLTIDHDAGPLECIIHIMTLLTSPVKCTKYINRYGIPMFAFALLALPAFLLCQLSASCFASFPALPAFLLCQLSCFASFPGFASFVSGACSHFTLQVIRCNPQHIKAYQRVEKRRCSGMNFLPPPASPSVPRSSAVPSFHGLASCTCTRYDCHPVYPICHLTAV